MVENENSLVPRICDKDPTRGIHGNVARPVHQVLGINGLAIRAPGVQEDTTGIKDLYAMVPCVGHVDPPVIGDGDAPGLLKLAIAQGVLAAVASSQVTLAAPLAKVDSSGIEYLFTSEPTIRPWQVKGCALFGRFVLESKDSSQKAAALTAGNMVVSAKELLLWNCKQWTKRLAGQSFYQFRDWWYHGSARPN